MLISFVNKHYYNRHEYVIIVKTQSNKKTKIHNSLHCVYSILARFLMDKNAIATKHP